MKRIMNFLVVLAMLAALCPAILVQAAAPEYFEPFKLTVARSGGSGNLRLVLKTNQLPAELQGVEAGDLVGAKVNGTATLIADTTQIITVDVAVTRIEVNSEKAETTLVLPLPQGMDNAPGSKYTYDLTLSPARQQETETVKNFKPFQISVKNLGSYGAGAIRLVVSTDGFNFDATAENILSGCTVSGKMTRIESSAGYSDEVIFTDVPIAKSLLRTDKNLNLDLELTDEISKTTIDMTETGGFKAYTYSLTISPAKQQETIPDGTVFLKAEDFASDMGTWKMHSTDKEAMTGLVGDGVAAEPATVLVDIPADGTYYIYGLAFDDAVNSTGKRTFKLGVNDETLPNFIGNHGGSGYAWQLAGECNLKAGENLIKVIDTSRYYTRLKGIMLTPAADYQGPSDSMLDKAFTDCRANLIRRIELVTEAVMGDRVKYKINNRTNEALTDATVYAAVYDENKRLMEIKSQAVSLEAGTSTGFQTIEFSGKSTWKSGKVMLWNSQLAPLVSAAEFYFTQTDLNAPDENADDYYGTNSDMMIETYSNEKEFNARSGISNTINKLKKTVMLR